MYKKDRMLCGHPVQDATIYNRVRQKKGDRRSESERDDILHHRC